MNNIKGFTLIELIIALGLGLLIIAAGFSIFLSGQRSAVVQSGMGELQQNANFGLSILAHDIRHANLNTDSALKVNNTIEGSGVIFSAKNLPTGMTFDKTFYTESALNDGATDTKSDQFTIQYVPHYTKTANGTKLVDGKSVEQFKYTFNGVDCEGNQFDFDKSRIIVQRYYLKENTTVAGQLASYSLYCDAGYYVEGDKAVTGMNANAQPIMEKVDAFKIRLGVKNAAGEMRYMTVKEYTDLTSTNNNIQSIEVGVLSRSTLPMGAESLVDNTKTFVVSGSNLTLKKVQKDGPKYLRAAFSQVVALRNTLEG